MGYCDITNVTNILAQALTTSAPHDTTGKIPLWQIGNTIDSDITPELINQYIRWSDDQIDSDLTEMYRVPLHKVAHGEWPLEQDIDEYNPTNIVVADATNLVPGDEILIVSTAFSPPIKERHFVATIVDEDEFTTVDPIFTNFPAGDETRIVRIGFPVAITRISSLKSAAHIYDKYFSANASPNTSEYVDSLRGEAKSCMNDILNGAIILLGQDRLGNRFANATLYDRYLLIQRDGNEKRDLHQK